MEQLKSTVAPVLKRIQPIITLISDTSVVFGQKNVTLLAGALAYYTIFSLAPLLVLAVSIASSFLQDVDVQADFLSRVQASVSPQAASFIESIIQQATESSSSATIVGLVLLLFGASGVFASLQNTLNAIWDSMPAPGQGIMVIIKARLIAFAMVLSVGVILLLVLAVGIALRLFNSLLTDLSPQLGFAIPYVDLLISLTLLTGVFALVLKFVPDADVAWKDVFVGGAVTAVLFNLGESLISRYLSSWSGAAVYGAASSLVVLLFWIYLSAIIFLFGATFTRVYAETFGSGITPNKIPPPTQEENGTDTTDIEADR